MKKLLATLVASIVIVGCTIIPTPQTVSIAANGIGAATAAVVSQTEMDKVTQNNIVLIMNMLDNTIPETNSTCVATWTPIIDLTIQKLMTQEKIDIAQAALIRTATLLAAEGIDYMFYEHPEWKNYTDLVAVAIHGFVDGYTSVFAVLIKDVYPVNGVDIDMEAYQYMNLRRRVYLKK